MKKYTTIFSALLFSVLFSNTILPQTSKDSLNILYQIVSQQYLGNENILKIKLPPFLSTVEVMDQVKLSVQWPGEQPPSEKTLIYVFKETDRIGTESTTGAIYIPGGGFKWNLQNWIPMNIDLREPSLQEKLIYNTFLDSMFANGITLNDDDVEIKGIIARQFNISVPKLDSIYIKVKYWWHY
jgi:hypothetical protein